MVATAIEPRARTGWTEKLARPDEEISPLVKTLVRMPMLMWRLGLGALVGRVFMVLTTTGRKSGEPRRAVVEVLEHEGRKYVLSGHGPHSDWYRNIEADPRVTVQAAWGVEHMLARRVVSDAEIVAAYHALDRSPIMGWWTKTLGFKPTPEDFLAEKERLYFLTFDLTTEPTPAPLPSDLVWLWPVGLVGGVGGWLLSRVARR
jgi:deazaflavin-dependent oxidoreductase (nitroreductase family)